MPNTSRVSGQSLDDVLASYIEKVEAGQQPDQAALLARHPDLADELAEFFANHAQLAFLPRAFPAARKAVPADNPPLTETKPCSLPFGDYELLREIARGGMGVVYEARQVSLNRLVALKKILPEQVGTSDAVRRFRAEAEAAAHLDHPHIVPIYEVNEIEGQHYYTMKLIQGSGLDSRLDDFALPPSTGPGGRTAHARAQADVRQKRLAALLALVARAVHHAHLRGVLHRDLKPANILLDEQDNPHITDFGLAKRVGFDGRLSQSVTIVGTPSYMAPEQAMPQAGGLTTATDGYSLGSILYELLTGKPPFVGETAFDTLIQVLQQPPVPPRQLNPLVNIDLEAICLKCLEKDPGLRYLSTLAIAEDLERWGSGQPISLRPQRPAERAWRWGRRNPALAGLLLLMAGLLLLGFVGSIWAAIRIAVARDAALRNAQAATVSAEQEKNAREDADRAFRDAAAALEAEKKVRQENRRLLVAQYVANGVRSLDAGDLFGALPWYGAALQLDSGDAQQEEAHRVRLASVLRRCPRLVQVWFFEPNDVNSAFTPDGRSVILTNNNQARAWSIATGEAVTLPMVHQDVIERTAISGNGRRLVTAGADNTARLWDLTTGRAVGRTLKHDKPVVVAGFNRDGNRVATASADLTARVWDAASGLPVTAPLNHAYPVQSAVFSLDGRRLLTAAADATAVKSELLIWDAATGKQEARVPLPKRLIRWAALTPDGKYILTVGASHRLCLFDPATGRPVGLPLPIGAGVPDACFAPDGVHALKVVGSTVQLCDVLTGQARGPLLTHGSEVQLTAFSPDGRLILTAGTDRSVRVWDAATGQSLTPPLRHGRKVVSAAFSRAGDLLQTVSADGTVRVWDVSLRDQVSLPRQLRSPESSALSPDGQLTAAIDKEGSVTLRDALTDRLVHGPWQLPRAPVNRVAFSPDGQHLALATADAHIQVVAVATGKPSTPVLEGVGPLRQLLFTPSSQRVAVLGGGDLLQVWTAAGGELKQKHALPARNTWKPLTLGAQGNFFVTRSNEEVELRSVRTGEPRLTPLKTVVPMVHTAMSPNGQQLATATSEGTVYLWEVATGKPLAAPLHHGQPLQGIVWSCDSRRLATVSQERGVRVWSASDGQPLTPMLQHSEPLRDSTFNRDGSRLVTVGKGGSARVWDLSPDNRPVADLQRLTGLLSGQSLDGPSGGFVPVDTAGLRAAWPLLRARYPREFGIAAP